MQNLASIVIDGVDENILEDIVQLKIRKFYSTSKSR